MDKQRLFYQCKICGNIIEIIEHSGVIPTCCGEQMSLLQGRTEDVGREKHTPVAVRQGRQIKVDVGSQPHPMMPEHHISWIAVVQGDYMQRCMLTSDAPPSASFCLCDDGPVTLYEYCTVHGLWVAQA